MTYRIFLFNAAAASEDAPALSVAKSVLWNRANDSCGDDSALKAFAADRVCEDIRAALSEDEAARAQITAGKTVKQSRDYIMIEFPYAAAERILPKVAEVALRRQLSVYDKENDRVLWQGATVNRSMIDTVITAEEIRSAAEAGFEGACRFKLLENRKDGNYCTLSYAVIFAGQSENSFKDTVSRFYGLLRKTVSQSAELTCDDRCFCIKKEYGNVCFCLEAPCRNGSLIGYVENEKPVAQLCKRQDCSSMLDALEKADCRSRFDISARMRAEELAVLYPNPAERLSESMALQDRLNGLPVYCEYTVCVTYGAEVIFHVVEGSRAKRDGAAEFSRFAIDEEFSFLLLRSLRELYPYIYDRFYLTPNHLPGQLCVKWIEKLEYLKALMLSQEEDGLTAEYLDRYAATRGKAVGDCEDIRRQRSEIADIYDLFICWLSAQIYDEYQELFCDVMINVQGP